jgi:hypothetical protein
MFWNLMGILKFGYRPQVTQLYKAPRKQRVFLLLKTKEN